MTKFLAVDILDDEDDGLFRALVYLSHEGRIEVMEPTEIIPVSFNGFLRKAEYGFSERQRQRLYKNLKTLFEVVDSSVSFLELSPRIYKVDLDKDNVLQALINHHQLTHEGPEPDEDEVWEKDDDPYYMNCAKDVDYEG